MKVETEGMLSIGRFARRSGLTVKALRRSGWYAVVCDRVRVDDVTAHVPEAIMRVRQWLDERDVPCIESPLTIFRGVAIDEWPDVEVGWPFADAALETAIRGRGLVPTDLARSTIS
jgi:hypothetical protein